MTEIVRQYKAVIKQAHGIVPADNLNQLSASLQEIDNHLKVKITQKAQEDELKKELLGHASEYCHQAFCISSELINTTHLWTLRKKRKAALIRQAVSYLESNKEEILNTFLAQQSSKNENLLADWFAHLDHLKNEKTESLFNALQYRRYGLVTCLFPLKNRRQTETSHKFNQWKQDYTHVDVENLAYKRKKFE